ncbi:GNAT family N-acetyltransferase [Kurthia massiliensis]|uniref:GNAT family N-acetyltransferase n=1 Tax=Kurthia massiliensis TaxID=1033739 RepID=UPI000289790C|nr:GNAT family N-acetyltransferase [Kurthia massiliensis]
MWHLKPFDALTTKELYAILYERTNVFVVEQNCPYLEVDGKDEASYHLFKEEDGVIVAYLRILPPGVSYEQASLGRVLVKQTHRGQGIAQQLVQKGIDFVHASLGEKTIKIQAQAYLCDFYGSFGFEAISDVYLEDDIPHIDMLLEKA